MQDLKKIKFTKLKLTGSSLADSSERRWFQSRYKEINNMMDDILTACDVTLSKTSYRELVLKLEGHLGIEPTKEE